MDYERRIQDIELAIVAIADQCLHSKIAPENFMEAERLSSAREAVSRIKENVNQEQGG